jgi:hypothetical protein
MGTLRVKKPTERPDVALLVIEMISLKPEDEKHFKDN